VSLVDNDHVRRRIDDRVGSGLSISSCGMTSPPMPIVERRERPCFMLSLSGGHNAESLVGYISTRPAGQAVATPGARSLSQGHGVHMFAVLEIRQKFRLKRL